MPLGYAPSAHLSFARCSHCFISSRQRSTLLKAGPKPAEGVWSDNPSSTMLSPNRYSLIASWLAPSTSLLYALSSASCQKVVCEKVKSQHLVQQNVVGQRHDLKHTRARSWYPLSFAWLACTEASASFFAGFSAALAGCEAVLLPKIHCMVRNDSARAESAINASIAHDTRFHLPPQSC